MQVARNAQAGRSRATHRRRRHALPPTRQRPPSHHTHAASAQVARSYRGTCHGTPADHGTSRKTQTYVQAARSYRGSCRGTPADLGALLYVTSRNTQFWVPQEALLHAHRRPYRWLSKVWTRHRRAALTTARSSPPPAPSVWKLSTTRRRPNNSSHAKSCVHLAATRFSIGAACKVTSNTWHTLIQGPTTKAPVPSAHAVPHATRICPPRR